MQCLSCNPTIFYQSGEYKKTSQNLMSSVHVQYLVCDICSVCKPTIAELESSKHSALQSSRAVPLGQATVIQVYLSSCVYPGI